jgi:mannose-6-phosphate isomerase-like protein (cupin superfamily)
VAEGVAIMSYPPVRFDGPAGAGTAAFRPRDSPPDLTTARGFVDFLATDRTTAGEFGLYRWNMGHQVSGPDAHFHRTISESFFVLDGSVRLYDGSRWIDAAAGDFLYVPVGGIHAFKNESGAPASMLLLFAPGAPREAYFEALAEMASTGRQLSNDEYTEFLRGHDQYMV